MLLIICNKRLGSSRGLVDKGAGLVTKFRVRILQISFIASIRIEKASNLKMLLFYIASIVGYPFLHPKGGQTVIGSSAGNRAEVKRVSFYL